MKRLLASQDSTKIQQLYRFLQQKRIPVTVSEKGDQLELWVIQSSYYPLAKQLIAEFTPEQVDTASEHQAATVENSSNMLWHNIIRNTGWLTRLFAALVVLVYVGMEVDLRAVFSTLSISTSSHSLTAVNEPWRFFTPALMHFTALHIVFNVFWWWYLGGRIERYLGTRWLAAVLLFTAVTSNLVQFYSHGPEFGGLSGVVYGLLGFCWVYSWRRLTPLYLPAGLIGFMIAWLVLGYTDILWVNVANEAHLGGLLSGCLAGLVVRMLDPTPRQTRRY
ncbi:rhomboid family intramembrane serine protease [Idiomarina tyrosinivorans]|uniref:Rhomboid family intramembrane serine protease n=1 Tax=Idiomarina tyrosinivorans TaxID=1445662 RepID=A0A432ZTF2_9GAMM|nr:rhomboid family intramembrane serine protease [Idiomarina tyrosinivorans]RUO81163.1 rhomboid family intramembrane serine protease [Idiomarina tyrosinivorans]